MLRFLSGRPVLGVGKLGWVRIRGSEFHLCVLFANEFIPIISFRFVEVYDYETGKLTKELKYQVFGFNFEFSILLVLFPVSWFI